MQQIAQLKNLYYGMSNSGTNYCLEIPQAVHWLLNAQADVLYFKLSNKIL